jgi:DNA-binding transcriptional regulator YhcF (GntR family)
MHVQWSFDDFGPIYLQIKKRIKTGIVSGEYPPGSRLPSVRDMAEEAAVNPNTFQKALAELEREGLLITHRTSGRFVTEDESMLEQYKAELAKSYIDTFLQSMAAIGYDARAVAELIARTGEAE